MNPAVLLLMLFLAALAGACFASACWMGYVPRVRTAEFARGKTAGHLEAATACVRRLDAEYRAGYANGERDVQALMVRPALASVLVGRHN